MHNNIIKYITLKSVGIILNKELCNSKGSRNPFFLQHDVKYNGIDKIGSIFRKEIFSRPGYDSSDYYDPLGIPLFMCI